MHAKSNLIFLPLISPTFMKICMLFITRSFTRDSIYAIANIYATPIPSVCPSVTRVICVKRLNASAKFFYHLIGPSF